MGYKETKRVRENKSKSESKGKSEREREMISKSWPQILFSFKRGGKCLFGLIKKTKGNLINTVNSATKVFMSDISFVCKYSIQQTRGKKKSCGCLFEKMKKIPSAEK